MTQPRATSKPTFFKTPSHWRRWLETNHADKAEIQVGFYKKDSGKPSITWPEAVDEALCFGWIDGVRKGVDDNSYTIRFTPRKQGSAWSAVNIKRVQALIKAGRMHPAGLAAFEQRSEAKSKVYSYEQERDPQLDQACEGKLKASKKAWTFFQSQPASYRRKASWWVMSAKKEETRLKRLTKLIEDSQNGLRLDERKPPA